MMSTTGLVNAQALTQEAPDWRKLHYLSEEEMLTPVRATNFTETPAPTEAPRFVAEFEPMQGVMIRYPLGIPVSLVKSLAENCPVYCIVSQSQQSSARSSFSNAGVNMNRVTFVIANSDSYWVRDYGPWYIFAGKKPAIVDNVYNRPRPNDDAIPSVFATFWDITMYGMNLEHTGGNMMQDGRGHAVNDDLVISENNNKDNVLNFLLDKSPRHQLIEIDDKANAKAEIDMWLKNDAVKLSDIQKQLDLKVAQLRERVEAELQQLIVKQLNRDFGVGGTLSVLNAIKSNINVFAEEIGEELEILNSRTIAARENTMKIAIQDLTEYNGKFFKLKSHLIELTEGAIQAATQLAEQQRDALRHESAIQFYNGMKQLLQDAIDHVEAIRRQLLTVNANVQTRLSELQNYVGRNPRTFQIDLALDTNVSVKDDELNMNALIQSIGLPNGIYDFSERKPEEIEPFFVDYCMGLNSAKELGDRSIDDIVNEMSDEEFDSLLTMAIKKSEPLFRFDYHGHAPKERPTNSFYVGVLNRDDSRLKRGNAFKLKLPGNPDVDFASIGQKDRIIIYRQRGVVPAYALTGIPTYRVRYENCTNCDCHFDADIEQRMRREGYTLEPSTKNDDTLEFWVKGLIFGLIKNEDGCYYVKNEDNDSLALNDYWESLGAYRDDAYKAFKQRLPLVADSFEKFFNNYQNSVGNDAIQRIINDVKLEQNYLQKYSQIGMTVEEIQKKGNESLKKLIVEEINYVKKEL